MGRQTPDHCSGQNALGMFPGLLVSNFRVVLLIDLYTRMQFQTMLKISFLRLVGPYRLSIELLQVRQGVV